MPLANINALKTNNLARDVSWNIIYFTIVASIETVRRQYYIFLAFRINGICLYDTYQIYDPYNVN